MSRSQRPSGSAPPLRRVHNVPTRLSDEELAAVRARSRACGLTTSAYLRESALGTTPRARHGQQSNNLVHHLASIARALSIRHTGANSPGGLDTTLADLRAAIERLVKKRS